MEKEVKSLPRIIFNCDEDCQPRELIDVNTVVYASSNQSRRGSSKVKLKSIVDYKWETKTYPGHLIAVHIDGQCVAYVIKVSSRATGAEGMVRVMSCGKRALIKGMKGEVLDLQFAHNEKEHILACAESAVLHVYKIEVTPDSLICSLLFKIEDPISSYNSKYDKLVWCPYVADEVFDCEDDANQIIVWARGNSFQCFNINIILNTYGKGKYAANDFVEGYLTFADKSIVITWIALSPDGTTLSVGSEDGYIRFYQIYFHERQPRRLHQWNPHQGQPISSFFFLDNLTKTSSDAYWKYALTGANANTEFKIWDCGSWDCLQMLSLKSNENGNISFIADIDRTASYLIISSVEINIVYVIQLVNGLTYIKSDEDCFQNVSDVSPYNNPKDGFHSNGSVFMKSISEFPLSSPFLSFSIVDATIKKCRNQEPESVSADDLDEEEDNNFALCVVIRMFVVQPKSVQECHVIYQPTVSDITDVRSSLTGTENHVKISHDLGHQVEITANDISDAEHKSFDFKNDESQQSNSHREKNIQITTTAAYSTREMDMNTKEVSKEVMSTLLMLANVKNTSIANEKTVDIMNKHSVNNKIYENQEQKNTNSMDEISDIKEDIHHINCVSGGSSPSREVQQILSNSSQPQNIKDLPKMSSNNCELFNKKIKELNIHALNESSANAKIFNNWNKLAGFAVNQKKKVEMNQLTDLDEINLKLNQLMDLIQIQSNNISEIRSDMQVLKKQNSDLVQSIKFTQFNGESYLTRVVEESLIRHDIVHKQRIDDLLNDRNSQTKELKDHIVQLINQFLLSQLPEKQLNSLAIEVEKRIAADVLMKLEVMDSHIQNKIGQKLTSVDNYFKESFAQLCQNKSIISTFGDSIMTGVENSLQNVYIHSMSNILIPAYEKSSKEMFKQLHDAFSLGVKDIMGQFENYFLQIQPIRDGLEAASSNVHSFLKFLEKFDLKQRSCENESFPETRNDFRSVEANIVRTIADTIQKEVRKNFETQAATIEDSVLSVVRSQAHTPVPTVYDIQDQIRYLLYQGHINKAFHQALIANDLVLVEYVLEKADYKNVFNPCVLEQTVLLSLIQQISADLQNHNDLKQRYLADAFINLNHTDPIIKEHAPRVMKEFWKNCQSFLLNNSKNQLCSNIKMIMMAVQGMGFKVL